MTAFCTSPPGLALSSRTSAITRRLSPTRRPTARARHPAPYALTDRGAYYLDAEGFGELPDDTLPDSVIYASLRRKAESMTLAAAIAECNDLAGAAVADSRAAGPLAPRPSLSPRDVVQGILAALQSDPVQGGRVAVLFSSSNNAFAKCTPHTLTEWLSTSELSFLLDISSFFVAPVPVFSQDRSKCVLACVVNTSANSKHGISFSCSRNQLGHWLVESVHLTT
jgi:hypothetical protein